MMGIYDLNKTKKNWGGCHHLLLFHDASKSKLSAMYVLCTYLVKSPVLGLQRAFFQKS